MQLKQDRGVEQIFWGLDSVFFHLNKYILPSGVGRVVYVQLYMLFVN